MYFKNAIIYTTGDAIKLTTEQLMPGQFTECKSAELMTIGFVNPMTGVADDDLVYMANGHTMISIRVDSKIIPGSAVKKLVADRVAALTAGGTRKPSKKEINEIKDEIIFSLAPTALIKSGVVNAYIDGHLGLIIVDAASAKKAEDLLSFLRKTLGSLVATPLSSVNKPSAVMTGWMLGVFPDTSSPLPSIDIAVGDDGGTAKFKKINLLEKQILDHINNGGQVVRVDLQWKESLSFSLSDTLALKKIKLLDEATQGKGETETAADRFAADFAIFTGVMSEFIPELLQWFGGKQSN